MEKRPNGNPRNENSISEIKNLLRRIRQMDMIEERINNL